ncbi:unnamed protein product [Boreogadus saida]
MLFVPLALSAGPGGTSSWSLDPWGSTPSSGLGCLGAAPPAAPGVQGPLVSGQITQRRLCSRYGAPELLLLLPVMSLSVSVSVSVSVSLSLSLSLRSEQSYFSWLFSSKENLFDGVTRCLFCNTYIISLWSGFPGEWRDRTGRPLVYRVDILLGVSWWVEAGWGKARGPVPPPPPPPQGSEERKCLWVWGDEQQATLSSHHFYINHVNVCQKKKI